VLEAAPPPGFALPGLLGGGPVEIVNDERGIGQLIAVRLAALGVDARAVEEVSAEASSVIFAAGLLARDSQEQSIAVQRAALKAARTLARRKGSRVLVTLQDTGGDFAVSGRAGERAWSGGLAGLAKTAVAEWPDAAAKAIDVACSDAPPDTIADRIVAELLLGGRDVEVALGGDGARAIVRHRLAPYRLVPPAKARIQPGSVIVVSGGARGVTARSLASLCKAHPKLALLGRTELADEPPDVHAAVTDADVRRALLARATQAGIAVPPKELAREAKLILDCREIRENIAALRKAGAEVSYHVVDVRSADAVRACVDEIRRTWGPIQGLIHGAGVLADALLASQTDEQFDRVFGTKVDGLRHLLAATATDPLSLVILFSSVAGRLGNSAQAAYAMANEVLSSVAANERVRRGGGCLVRSLAWGPWAGGMVTPGLARLFEKAGVQMIALDSGAEALAREVASEDDFPEVVLMNGEPPLTARPIHGGRIFNGEERFEILVNAATYPCLDGHRISGVPVVPAVMAIEWFLRASLSCCPTLAVRTCHSLKVLRGVPVEAFEQRGTRLFVQARVLEGLAPAGGVTATLELRLLDEHDKPRYSAVVEMGEPPAVPGAFSLEPRRDATGGPSSTWSVEQAYAEILFHRGPFRAIRSLYAVFDDSASGEVVGLRALGWPDADWCCDPALLDGGLQIALIWGRHVLGRPPLPTAMGALHLYRRGPIHSAVRCTLRGSRTGKMQLTADLFYSTDTGAPLAYIQGLQLHLPLGAERTITKNGAA
jgi:NAD(P)-dependent dehydrogenase (short-subunit alcohol dehydrogenase family)